MSGKGKRKEESDNASDGDADSEGHAPPKKSAKKDSDDPDSILICDLSKNRRISVRNWQGKAVIDIREFYVKDGKQLPGKKGISLTMDQWKALRDHVEEIDKAINENENS